MNYEILLAGLGQAAKSPLAFVAYILIIVSWTTNYLHAKKLKIIASKLNLLPESQRLEALKLEYNLRPKKGLNSEQFLKSEKRKYFLIAFIISAIGILVFLGLSTYKSLEVLKSNVQQQTMELAFTTFIKGTATAEDNKRWESAITQIESAVTLHPTYGAYINLANMYDEIGNSQAALNASIKAMELKPENPSPYMKIGMYYSDLDNFDSAKYYLEKSLIIFEKSKISDNEFYVSILGNLGNLYSDKAEATEDNLQKKHYAEIATSQYFDKALKLKGQLQPGKYLAMLLGNAGNSYRVLGDISKAEALLNESVALKENLLHKTKEYNSLGYGYLYSGDIYLEKKDFKKANEFYSKVHEIFFNYGYPIGIGLALFGQGNILFELKKSKDALSLFEKAKRIFVEKDLPSYIKLVDIKISKLSK